MSSAQGCIQTQIPAQVLPEPRDASGCGGTCVTLAVCYVLDREQDGMQFVYKIRTVCD